MILQGSTQTSFTVSLIEDGILESAEMFQVQLEPAAPSISIRINSVTVTILDNDGEKLSYYNMEISIMTFALF